MEGSYWYPGVGMFFIALGVVSALLLFRASERRHGNKWAWGVAGLLFNIFALIAYRLMNGKLINY